MTLPLAISELNAIAGTAIATDDLEAVVDISDLTMAITGSDKRVTALEKARAYLKMAGTQRNLVTAFGAYNPGDIVTLSDGRVVQITTACSAGAGPTPFISAANYILYVPGFYIIASAYGVVFDANPASATANTAALQAALNAANPTAANGAGGIVLLSKGNFYTNAFIQIPIGVTLMGNSTFGTYWSLANGSNCSMVGPHVSTGSGNGNAFYWGIRDLSMDCRQSSQGVVVSDVSMTTSSTTITSTATPWVNGQYVHGSGILPGTTVSAAAGAGPYTATLSLAAQQTLTAATVYTGISAPIYGVHCNVNPLTTAQTGDWAFDPSGLISNVVVKNARDAAFANFGRSANVYFRCKTSVSLGIGFIGSFDTRYLSCEADFPAWHGWDLRGSSEQLSNCKSYNCGQVKTTAAAVSNQAHGYKCNGFSGFGELAIAGCDAQQVTGNGFEMLTCSNVSISGCTVAVVGYTSAVTTNVGFNLSNCQGCTIVSSVSVAVANHCYSLIGGSIENTIILGFVGVSKGTAAGPGNSDVGNFIVINGTAVNAPGLVASATVASAMSRVYGRQSSTGGHYTPGQAGAAAAAVLNRLELAPLPVPRAAMTCSALTVRVAVGVASAVVRCGLYTSDFSGGGDHTLLAELPSQFDASTSGVKTITFTAPIALDDTLLLWLGVVPQGVLSASFNGGIGNLVATNNALGANYGFTQNTVTGALPATISYGVAGMPVGVGTGYLVDATLIG